MMVDGIAERIKDWDWQFLTSRLDAAGYVKTPVLLTAEECAYLSGLYPNEELFRSEIDMAKYGFGSGTYKYFCYPLPPIIQTMRETFYPLLVPIANGWLAQLQLPAAYPATLAEFTQKCAAVQQTKPTPLILRYEEGGYNCLHQDLYGEIAFPLQVVIVVSQVEKDYTGGEFLLVEQRPRAQSVGYALALQQGQGLIFTNRYRPVASKRGYYRANVRHGVSEITSGVRYSLGIIFHEAN